MMKRRLIFPLLIASCLPFSVQAQQADADVAALLKAVNEQAERLQAQEKNLAQEKAKFEKLRAQVEVVTGQKAAALKPAAGDSETRRAAAAPVQPVRETSTAATSTPAEVGVDRKPVDEKPPEIATLGDQGGVLLPSGKLVLTPSIEYQRSSATRVAVQGFSIVPAINIGLFEIAATDRDTYTAALSARYGITNRLEAEVKVPYIYRVDATRTRPIGAGTAAEVTSNVDGKDIGDVEFSARYQINNGHGGWPFFIGGLRFKTATGTNPYEVPLNGAGVQTELPTGSGFYALQPNLTAIYPSDPVVYYANLGYLYNFERDFGGAIGEIHPGDSVSGSFGMSLTLNDKASLSFGYSHNTVFKPKINGVTVPNATFLQVGTLDVGYSYGLSPHTNLNFVVSAGITEDAPDARLTLRVPLTFDGF